MKDSPNRLQRAARFVLYAAGLALMVSCGQSVDTILSDATTSPDAESIPVGSTSAESAGEAPVATPVSFQQERRSRPAGDDSDEPQTRLIRTLDDALDEVDTGDEDIDKGELRTILYEADRELRHVLGGKSKEAILRANRKPPIRYRHEQRKPAAKPEQTATPESEDTAAE